MLFVTEQVCYIVLYFGLLFLCKFSHIWQNYYAVNKYKSPGSKNFVPDIVKIFATGLDRFNTQVARL